MDRRVADPPLVSSLDQTTPVLRRELTFRPQTFGDRMCYVVEDPACSRFFRIGVAEYTFISLLDGKSTVREALDVTLEARPDCGFSPADAMAICQWVTRTGLACNEANDRTQGDVPAENSANTSHRSPKRSSGGRLGPLSMQLPLVYPDRIFERVKPFLSWCFSLPAFVVWLVVIGWAVRDLVANSTQLAESSSGLIAANNWIWLGLAWVVLKVIHECGHAVSCKRLGGEVREAGIILILFAPLAYVDVTSSWRLSSKWARIQVAAAGMYVELFVAALAAVVWSRTDVGIVHQLCLNIMTTAGVMTLLFNANPLMRFDGYYILSDLLEMPNLYSLGRQYVTYVSHRVLFGLSPAKPDWKGFGGTFIRSYGVASLVWRNLVFVGLVLSAATLFDGAGLVLAVLAVGLWVKSMCRRLARLAQAGSGQGTPNWRRFGLVTTGLLLLSAIGLSVTPWPGTVTAPAIVQYYPQIIVRAECDGFVAEVLVSGGQPVEAGQLLVEMRNQELEHELEQLAITIRESRINQRVFERNGELAKSQAEGEDLRTLEKQYAEKQLEVARLVIRAPHRGIVIGRGLDAIQGTYLSKGSQILAIGDEHSKQIRLSIAQKDINEFRSKLGAIVPAYLPGTAVVQAEFSKIEPRASTVPIDPSLCAPEGGDLTVRSVSETAGDTNAADLELISPRFTGVLSVNIEQSQRLFAGQRAQIALRPFESVGHHFYRVLADWIEDRLALR